MTDEQELGQLALVIGDLHLPQRTAEIPAKFKEMLLPNKVAAVFCTGNVGSRQPLDWLRSLSSSLHVVRGDFEDEALGDFPEEKIIEELGFRVGLLHGHQLTPWGDDEALAAKAKQMGVRVLIAGHSHIRRVAHVNGVYLLNPGSLTGAYSCFAPITQPSFLLFEFKSTELVVYEYTLTDDNPIVTVIPKSELV